MPLSFSELPVEELEKASGTIVVFAYEGGEMTPGARRADIFGNGIVSRAFEAAKFTGKLGESCEITFPPSLSAERVILVGAGKEDKLEAASARQLGAKIALITHGSKTPVQVFTQGLPGDDDTVAEIGFGFTLRSYIFSKYKKPETDAAGAAELSLGLASVASAESKYAPYSAVAQGISFTRDLVNEPGNILTPEEFARRLRGLTEHGVEVEVFGEKELEEMGFRALLGVGRGSARESHVVVMQWKGGGDEDPLALVGKGVTFDSGGISLKPGAGMEEMTMDMGGAGVVAGVMKALALREAPANVVGIVGLVENMPDANAQRPGDIVTSLSGQTIEIINTDAEGRLVLADLLWYVQERFNPQAMIDLATLTGAIIVALGHEMAGFMSNDATLTEQLLHAAEIEGEGLWQLPLGKGYDNLLKSRLADMKNIGGRAAGSISAAQFLQRFVKDETPWTHIDIAGVTLRKEDLPLGPKGATGWGVMTLNRLIAEYYEGQG